MSQSRIGAPNPGATAVPVYLPLGFVAAGIFGFLLLLAELPGALPSSMLYVRHNAHLLVLVHLFTLVWGSGVTLGVLHQLAPVILSAPLHSARLGWLTLALFMPGSFLLAISFRTFRLAGVIAGGTLVLLGALVFAYNFARTLRSAEERSVTSRYLAPALASFIATLAFGIAMAASLKLGVEYRIVNGFLLSHLFLGGAGWFAGVIMAVTYRLAPMFLLVHGHDERAAARLLGLHYAGVALGVAGSLWGGRPGPLPGMLLILAAVAWWAVDLRSMWKKRVRRPDAWMRQVPVSVACLVAAALGAAACAAWEAAGGDARPRAVLAVGVLFALGCVSAMILALLHKIVPFLVWYHRYGDSIGRGPAPVMKDLVNERVGKLSFPAYYAAVAAISAAAALGQTLLAQYAAWALLAVCALLAHDLLWLMVPVDELKERFASRKTLA